MDTNTRARTKAGHLIPSIPSIEARILKNALSQLLQIPKFSILMSIKLYQKCVSPLLPQACRFDPTCSNYLYEAIEKKGLLRGLYMGAKRILKCHPFHKGGIDPVE